MTTESNMTTKTYTLYDAVRDGATLSTEHQQALLALLGSGCRKETKARLARRLALPLSLMPNRVIFSRVYLRYDREGVHYCAGQSYTDEVRLVRKLVLEG